MRVVRVAGAVALAFTVALLFAAKALALPPVEAFGNLPEYSHPALSPDGKHFAVVRAVKGRNAVAIYAVDAPEDAVPALVDANDGHIVTVAWANDDRVIIVLKGSARPVGGHLHTWWRAFSVDAEGRHLAAMLADVPGLEFSYNAADIADLDLDDPDHIFMPLIGPGVFNSWPALHVYKVDVNSGRSQVFSPGTMWTADWIMDGHGHVIARVDIYVGELKYHIKVPAGDDYAEIGAFDLEAGGVAHVSGASDDGKGLVMEQPTGVGRVGLYRLDLGTKATTELFANSDYDVDHALVDEWSGHVVGAAYAADKMENFYFDPGREKLQHALERAFPGRAVAVESCDVARRSCIVRVDGPRNPPTFYFFDVASMRAYVIGSAYPQLTAADLGEVRDYSYTARDGLRIPAYLTLPPTIPAKNLPLVVMPHGGPETRDYLTFNWWVQFLANRGYAVLQPNYRGSRGYGRDFMAAGFHQWGLKMQDDLADGVAKLVADGIADPKRVCIVGASYGGYAALAGAAFGNTYACAVSVAGVSDLAEMLKGEERDTGADSSTMSYWQSRIGSLHGEDSTRIAEASPALHVDNVRIPVLLLHGLDDTTVPIAQSREMRDALTHAHKRVAYIELEGDDHYFDLAATRIRVLSEIEKFLAANIGR